MDKNLTTKEAAEFLGISKGTMERMRKDNQGPPYFKIGRVIRYSLQDLKEWIAHHKRS